MPTAIAMRSPTRSLRPSSSAATRMRRAITPAPSGPVFGRKKRNELVSKRPRMSVSRDALRKIPARRESVASSACPSKPSITQESGCPKRLARLNSSSSLNER